VNQTSHISREPVNHGSQITPAPLLELEKIFLKKSVILNRGSNPKKLGFWIEFGWETQNPKSEPKKSKNHARITEIQNPIQIQNPIFFEFKWKFKIQLN
jgi:hypothetical protein